MKRFLLLLLALAVTAPVAWSQKPYKDIDTPPLPNFDIPEAKQVELSNGMKVFLIEDHELPLIEMSARVGTGSIYEPAELVGLASITGTVMRTGGTESLDGDALNETLENMGAIVETYVGESSGGAYMSSLKETIDDVLPVYVDVIVNPAFPDEKIDLAKTQERSMISRRNDDPQQIAFREFDKLVYGGDSPYARHTEYATIDAISRDDLIGFHREYFHPNNTILGVWGDFDTDEMVQKLENAFGAWSKHEGFERPPQPDVNTGSSYGVFYAPKMDVTQSTVLMGHPGEIRMDHPDYFAVTVMNQVLSGFTGRLFQNVRDDKGLAYSVFGGYSANYERPGRFYAGIMTKSETTVEGANAVREEIEKLKAAPPSADELDLAKDSYLNSFVFNFDTRQEIVNRMMTYEYHGYPLDFLNQVRAGVQEVGPSEVHSVAQRYLKPDQMKILAVGNHEDFGEPLSELGPVDTLDIAIPSGREPEPKATEETLSKGRELLAQAVDVLGGIAAFQNVETFHQQSSTSVTTPDGQQMTIHSEMYADYPDRMRIEQSLPMGTIAIVVNGEEVSMSTPQGTMQAPPPVRRQINAQRWRDVVYLFANSDAQGLEVQHVGSEEVDGETAEVLRIDPPGEVESFRLLIDADSKEPVAMVYTAQNMMTGAPTEAREVFVHFHDVGDLRLPQRTISYQDGQQAAETTVGSTEINMEIGEDVFSLDN